MRAVFEALLRETENARPCVLVTISSVSGTAPRGPGTSMLVGEDGTRLAGTVGGGDAEWQAQSRAVTYLKAGKNGRETLTHGSGAKITLRFTCCPGPEKIPVRVLKEALSSGGGTLLVPKAGEASFLPDVKTEQTDGETLYLHLPPKERAILFGAGHVAKALCPLLNTLGFSVTVYDDRKELAQSSRFPEAEAVLTGPYSGDIAAVTNAKAEDYIVIMSASREKDEQILSHFTDRSYRYIGMLGSRQKAAAIRDSLTKKGVPEARLKEVHIPIGLDIGARTPEEVALSAAAELVKTRAETGSVTR